MPPLPHPSYSTACCTRSEPPFWHTLVSFAWHLSPLSATWHRQAFSLRMLAILGLPQHVNTGQSTTVTTFNSQIKIHFFLFPTAYSIGKFLVPLQRQGKEWRPTSLADVSKLAPHHSNPLPVWSTPLLSASCVPCPICCCVACPLPNRLCHSLSIPGLNSCNDQCSQYLLQ